MVKKILRSKIFLCTILLVFVAIMVFYLLPLNYEKQNQTVDVVQFTQDVTAGTKITEGMLTTRTIGVYGVDNNVITKKSDIVGKYAAMDIRRTTNLYSDMFANEWQEVDGALDLLLREGDKLITISLGSGAQSVGGDIAPGSVVDILTVKLDTTTTSGGVDEFGYPIGDSSVEEGSIELVPLLENVIVYKVLNNALENITELRRQWVSLVDSGDDAANNFDSSLTPAFLTLIVSDEQAMFLANQEYNGNFHIVLDPLADASTLDRSSVSNATDDTGDVNSGFDPFAQFDTQNQGQNEQGGESSDQN